ncbi:SlyX family protein [Amylibacter sp. IMCC11727]|uniref:SlyX family protein n=1 Tax=Amylibacter sp. IMCC11727 TaxID=3039851 RepID=UPI00244DD224|nr:SlyX family protein [Amylibacter sp. IMCC11727]WGI21360.1 SlyX family protein [Amylibacter sp. IMCC11727]
MRDKVTRRAKSNFVVTWGPKRYPTPMTDAEHITQLEERLAHTTRQAEDLSEVVADQAKRIDMLEKQMKAVLEMARDTAQGEGSVTLGDQPPPHW